MSRRPVVPEPAVPQHGEHLSAPTTIDLKSISNCSGTDDTRRPSATTILPVAHHSKAHPVQFQSNTIAPSPPLSTDHSSTASELMASTGEFSSSLRISTDICSFSTPQRQGSVNSRPSLPGRSSGSIHRKASNNNLHPISRTPSLKKALSQSFGGTASGASSVVASPIISAMGDMTPLPSPLLSADSPGPWKKLITSTSPKSRNRLGSVGESSILGTSPSDSLDIPSSASVARRKGYASLEHELPPPVLAPPLNQPPQQQQHHTRNRSASEYIPDPSAIPKRHLTVSGTRVKPEQTEAQEPHIRREANLAQSRGLTPAVTQPPTPPPSESSKDSTDGSSQAKDQNIELFEARDRHNNKKRRWRGLRCLGQGTFSRVMLATSQIVPSEDESTENPPDRKTLVAVKVCEHGPRGGASEDRVEMSLKRELEILQDIHHPSLVDLKAFSIEPTRAILVLTYSPGGDLFDVATAHRPLLTPKLLRRVFAELVNAVAYLHEKRIVHRDIKLENVLVNLTPTEIADPSIDWATFPYSITTLTDLGLSRRITNDEKLETRCSSEDYAAPEVIMGQPYDGRATDAWSLGVLLYALLEARLPFDPHPGMTDAHRMRSRTSHRIARVEWRWVEYAGDDGDHEANEAKFREKDLFGAMEITEGLLKRARSRWTLDKVASTEWVLGALSSIDGGLKFWEEEAGQEVL